MSDIERAGRWLHNWVPLDAVALKEKFHGHVPAGAKVGMTKHGTGLPATPPGMIHVYDVHAGKSRLVTKAEAAAGHQRYGKATFRPGSPAAGVVEQRALDLAREARGVARAAGMVTNPSGTERLHQYWVHGEGAAKIRWGAPGDFSRCVLHLGKFIKDPKGYCAEAHHSALGIWPATHAAEIKHGTRRSAVTEPAGGYDGDGLDASWDGDCGDLPDLTGLSVEHMQAAEQAMGITEPDQPVSRAMPKLGSGARFKKLKSSLAAKGASDPGALAAYIGRKKFGKAKFAKLAGKARGGGGMRRGQLVRYCQFEDIHILRSGEGDSTGRVVEGYAAVFGQPVEIRDGQGHYEEEIDRQAFAQWLTRTERRQGGIAGAVRCLYNHGKTMEGLPAPEFQRPLGKVLEIRADSRGLLTRTEYKKSPLAEEILDDIREGRLTAQSFEGPDYASDPPLRGPGDRYRKRGGALTRVRRMVLGMTNFGPALYAAYQGAEFLGVRMGGDFDDFDEPEPEDESPAMEGELTGGVPEDTTSARYHQHALYRLRAQEQRERIGLHW